MDGNIGEQQERQYTGQQREEAEAVLAVTEYLGRELLQHEEPNRRTLIVVKRLEELRQRARGDVEREVKLVEPQRPVREIGDQASQNAEADDCPGDVPGGHGRA